MLFETERPRANPQSSQWSMQDTELILNDVIWRRGRPQQIGWTNDVENFANQWISCITIMCSVLLVLLMIVPPFYHISISDYLKEGSFPCRWMAAKGKEALSCRLLTDHWLRIWLTWRGNCSGSSSGVDSLIRAPGDLSQRQFDVRIRRLTVNAVMEIVNAVQLKHTTSNLGG